MSRRILAIDPGTQCGYAWADDGVVVERQRGVLDLKPSRHEGAGMRFLRFERHLTRLAPAEIYYEEVAAHKGTAAAHIYGGLIATIQTYCEERGVPYQGVPVGTIKRHATGKGNANKSAMILAAKERLGYDGHDDNEADALWLLSYALKRLVEEGGATNG